MVSERLLIFITSAYERRSATALTDAEQKQQALRFSICTQWRLLRLPCSKHRSISELMTPDDLPTWLQSIQYHNLSSSLHHVFT